jgi:hydroxypyruvate reductase
MQTDKQTALLIFTEAVKAVQPSALLPAQIKREGETLLVDGKRLSLTDYDGIFVLCIGKAAAAMAQEAEKILGERILSGLVITKYQHSLPLLYCRIIEAGHPVPDENSHKAANEIVRFLQPLTNSSLLLCFISGGASALIGDIAEGLTLQDLQAVSTLLLQCGADIHELNTVRKHISFLKGGQMVKHANNATVFSFIISDVPGDDMGIIASGLTVPDASTFADALGVLEKYGLVEKIPLSIKVRLLNGLDGVIEETPKPGSPLFSKVNNSIIGNNNIALHAAALYAEALGFTAIINENVLHGEAKDAAKSFVNLLLEYKGKRPACLLAGGETTVTIKGKGKGGRNQEFALAALCELMARDVPENEWPIILSGGTDGTDGPTPAAGSIIDISDFVHINKSPKNPVFFLENNDSFNFLEPFGALIITGATQTNVMDVVIALIQ